MNVIYQTMLHFNRKLKQTERFRLFSLSRFNIYLFLSPSITQLNEFVAYMVFK